MFAWNFCIAAIWIGVIKWALSQLITDPAYLVFLQKSLPIRFFIAFLMTGWMALIHWLLFTFEESRENEKRKADADKLSKDAELYKLRQQLHPHFLFNSLNSISSLTGSRPEEARHMIQQLADFLRGTLKNDEKMLVSLEEELRYLQLYLDIEKVRFGHRLTAEVKYDDASLKCEVPQMLLQPIVENAIKFGLYDTTDSVTIKIDAISGNRQISIAIQNPFDPQTSQSRQGTGFGLSSIQRRLYLLYARKDLIETKAENNLFTTTVTIPQTA
jgi:LytS/YehU family sensor histidine kinase